MKSNKNIDWNIGYTTKDHLCIDFDNTSFFNVCQLTQQIIANYPEVGSALILLSSINKQSERWIYPPMQHIRKYVNKHNYHVIFNGLIPYEQSCKIIETLAYLGVINEEYIRIREMRNDMTIRVTSTQLTTKLKPKPQVIEYIYNNNDRQEKGGIYRFMCLYKSC